MGLSFNREPHLPFAFKTCATFNGGLCSKRVVGTLLFCVCVWGEGGVHLMEPVQYHLDVQIVFFFMKVGHMEYTYCLKVLFH